MANKPKKVEKTKKSKNKGDVAHASPEVRRVRVDEIVVKGDFRELDKKTVSSLAESIKEVGLMNPPTVFIKPSKDESGLRRYTSSLETIGWRRLSKFHIH